MNEQPRSQGKTLETRLVNELNGIYETVRPKKSHYAKTEKEKKKTDNRFHRTGAFTEELNAPASGDVTFNASYK